MIDPAVSILMIDVETTNDIDYPFIYDIGYQIFTLADGVLCEKSFVNADIFLDKELMTLAYFADKVPAYWEEIKAGKRTLRKLRNIKKELHEDCATYGATIACAHNARFDARALNITQRYQTTSRWRWFLPYGLTWWDTLKMAREVLRENEDYITFCRNNGFAFDNGSPRYTAEVIYRFLHKDPTFEEAHTGLEDVKIEREIFEYLLSQKPDIDGRLWG